MKTDADGNLEKAELILDALLESEDSFRETEQDLDSDPILHSQAIIAPSDWTVETIISQLGKGNIDLDPEFQRRGAWTNSRKSKFIESLILGLPIPQIVLAADKDSTGKYIVIDGKQRLLSLYDFCLNEEDPLRLTGTDILKDLDKNSYKDLQDNPSFHNYLRIFENQPIRSVVIRNWKNEQFLYLTYFRLNSGSLPLSAQELRQALRPGPFINFIKQITSKTALFRSLLNNMEPDFRMRDVELIIRFIAFKKFKTEYKGNLKAFLDDTCDRLNRDFDESEIKVLLLGLYNAIETTKAIFSVNAFRKWDNVGYEKRFNRSIFDIMTYYFADPVISKELLDHKDEIEGAFRSLCENNAEFKASLEVTTKSVVATATRFEGWRFALQRVLGHGLPE